MLVRQTTAPCWVLLAVLSLPGLAGCQGGQTEAISQGKTADGRPVNLPKPVVAVRCVYDLHPWMSFDKQGDRDPEGIAYRVFLDIGNDETVLRDGTFHIELYRIDRSQGGGTTRTLASDWHYPTSDINQIKKPGKLGPGYFVQLMWATKDIAGCEVELITTFEDPYGRSARSGTKRCRVPKYTS